MLTTVNSTYHSLLQTLSALDNLSLSLSKVYAWFTYNLLTLNTSKAEFLLVGTPQQRLHITNSTIKIDDTELIPSDTARNLGVIFDPGLLFRDRMLPLLLIEVF